VSHIKLTTRDRKDSTKSVLWVDPKAISFIEETEEGEAALCLSFSSEEYLTVTETPAEIAALIESARREARIRENAARLLAAFIVSGSELESTILHGVSGQHALSLERRLDEFFAAERAAKKTGEE